MRLENYEKSREIDQIKDLNIKLQIELEKYKQSASSGVPYTPLGYEVHL